MRDELLAGINWIRRVFGEGDAAENLITVEEWSEFVPEDERPYAFVLRRDLIYLLRNLGDRLETVKIGPFITNYRERVAQVEEVIPTVEFKQISAPIDAQQIESIAELSQLPADYIVTRWWLKLEQAIREALDIPTGPWKSKTAEYLKVASERGLLSAEEAAAVKELRDLRNQAVRTVDPSITITDALRYHDIANALIQKLKEHSASKKK